MQTAILRGGTVLAEITQLLDLQSTDGQLHELSVRIERLRAQQKQTEQRIVAEESTVNRLRKQLSQLEQESRMKNLEVDELDMNIRRYQERLDKGAPALVGADRVDQERDLLRLQVEAQWEHDRTRPRRNGDRHLRALLTHPVRRRVRARLLTDSVFDTARRRPYTPSPDAILYTTRRSTERGPGRRERLRPKVEAVRGKSGLHRAGH